MLDIHRHVRSAVVCACVCVYISHAWEGPKDWKYVTYPEENFMSELYDLSNDPDELYNLIDHPGFASKRKSLAVKLEDILEEMSRNTQLRTSRTL